MHHDHHKQVVETWQYLSVDTQDVYTDVEFMFIK